MNRTTSLLLLALALGLNAFSRDSFLREEYRRNFDKTIGIQNGQRVSLEHKFGDIVIHTHPQQDVTIHAEIRVSASDSAEAHQYADRVEVLVEPSSTELFIRTRYPETPKSLFGMHNISYSVHYDVLIPESSPLQIRNSFGRVSASGLRAGSDIVTSHGDLQFHDGRGVQRLQDSFGRVELSHNEGEVTIDTTNGSVDATDINGALTIRDRFAKVTAARVSNRISITNGNGEVDVNDCGADAEVKSSFGSILVHNVRGTVYVNNTNGRIDATGIGGAATLNTTFGDVTFFDIGRQLSIHSNNAKVSGNKVGGALTLVNSFGAVQVSDIQHELRIDTQNGEVIVDKIGGSAEIKTSFGAVRATNVSGLLTVNNNNGSVKASAVQGAHVRTSFAAVILDSVNGPIDVQDQNGSVEATSTLRTNCQPISIHSSFGAIRVHLPADASYKVFAKTSFGKIRSDFPLTLQGSMNSDEVDGTIGAGHCELSLIDQNASIEILRK